MRKARTSMPEPLMAGEAAGLALDSAQPQQTEELAVTTFGEAVVGGMVIAAGKAPPAATCRFVWWRARGCETDVLARLATCA